MASLSWVRVVMGLPNDLDDMTDFLLEFGSLDCLAGIPRSSRVVIRPGLFIWASIHLSSFWIRSKAVWIFFDLSFAE